MKDEFLATISHELRTPLNAVLGWLHLLRTGKLDPTTATRGLESIERNVRLQAQLTGDLLDVSKALTGQLRLDSRPVSLAEAVAAGGRGGDARRAGEGRARRRQRLPDAPVVVLGDPTRLRQIVWHLLANAIKFTPRGGTSGLTLEQSRRRAVLTVSDSGPGIDPEFLPRIFDRFTQEDASPTRTAGGLGRRAVARARARRAARRRDSRRATATAGTGAMFTARFPLQPGAVDGQARSPVPRDVPIRARRRSTASACWCSIRTPTAASCCARCCSSAARRCARRHRSPMRSKSLEAWRPDVLVSDSASPEHDSYALVGKVQSLEADRGGRIPAAALTAFARTDERVRQMLEPVQTRSAEAGRAGAC